MACCGGGNCGNKQSYGLPDISPSTPKGTVNSRYPTPNVDRKVLPRAHGWKHLPSNRCRQFDDYGKESTKDESDPPQGYTYQGANLAAVNFPIGGFGTGDLRIMGDGTLGGWCIVNQFHAPEHGPLHKMPANYFAVSATPSGGTQQTFALISPENYTEHNCNLGNEHEAAVSPAQVKRLQTIPGIKSLSMVGKYPIAETTFNIDGFPVTVEQEAMSPLIPNEVENSSIPVAVFTFTITNPSKTASVDVNLMQAQQNFVGWDGNSDQTATGPKKGWGGNINTPFSDPNLIGLEMTSNGVDKSSPYFGSIVASGVPDASTKIKVITSATDENDLFSRFAANQAVDPSTASPTPPSATGTAPCGGVVQSFTLAPGASKQVTFILSWNFPNRMRNATVGNSYNDTLPNVLGNAYATRFPDARASANFLVANSADLLGTTRMYRDTLYGSTIPYTILDSAAGRVAVMRSPTMWQCANGVVMGNEGNKCCPLNCSHVYGYTMLLERLYPSVAMDMHISAFVRNYNHGVTMRFGHSWAIDGALATIIKAYINIRQFDSKLQYLPKIWPNIKDQMNILLNTFDTNGDGVIRCEQQNTYDTAMQGANTFIGSYWVTALRSCAAMATLMGDTDFANTMAARAKLASMNYDKICWNEKFGYYIADVTINNCQHSYGPGCFVDQVCCGGLSSAAGFGYMFNADHEHSARVAIAKYNQVTAPPFKDLQGHFYPGDTGITVCTYPNGKLGNGMQYTTLVSAGFTSPVIAGLLLDRDTATAEHVAGNIRRRQDGRYASPWNEPECNILYSRSMAHWNLFDQACGLVYDATQHYLEYDPRYTPTAFNAFFNAEGAWGEFAQSGDAGMKNGTGKLTVQRGTLQLQHFKLAFNSSNAKATVDGGSVNGTYSNGVMTFSPPLTIKTGSVLTVTYTSSFEAVSIGNGRNACSPSMGSQCCPPPLSSTSVPELRYRKGNSCGPSAVSKGSSCCPPSHCDASMSKGCCPPEKGSQHVSAVAQRENYYVSVVKMIMFITLIFALGLAAGIFGPELVERIREGHVFEQAKKWF